MESILELLDNERIFRIELKDDNKTMVLTESCDAWFDHRLNKSQALQMLDELKAIIDKMSE